MKKKPARAILKAFVLVLSPCGRETILVKSLKSKRRKSWALPGGKIDEGESLIAGARREVLEETGVRVELETMVAFYKCARRDEMSFLFLGKWREGAIRPDGVEIEKVRWEPLETAEERVLCELNRQRIRDCLSFSGSPVYRLIHKGPFEVLESWDLGKSSLEGLEFPGGSDGVSTPGEESQVGSRWWPWWPRRTTEAESLI